MLEKIDNIETKLLLCIIYFYYINLGSILLKKIESNENNTISTIVTEIQNQISSILILRNLKPN